MASYKLFTGNPSEVTVIRKVTENITTFSSPFSRFGRMKIGARGTVVRLPSGALAVFSPTPLTSEVKSTLSEMGQVKYITAPDLEHHIQLGPWHEAYPEAKVIAPEGLAEKREKARNEKVHFDYLFTAKNKNSFSVDHEFDQEFDYEFVHAHGNKELVFNFKRDKTLIEADLLFNNPPIEQYSKSNENPHTGILTKFFHSFTGTSGNAALRQSRFIWYALSSGDRPAFNDSISKIDKWDFDRIIPCHGDVIETGGKSLYRSMFKWHLQAAEQAVKQQS